MMRPIGSTSSPSLVYQENTHENNINNDSQTKTAIIDTITQSNNAIHRGADPNYRILRRFNSDGCNLGRNRFCRGDHQIQQQDPNTKLQDQQPLTVSPISDTATALTTAAMKSKFSWLWDRCRQVVPSVSPDDSSWSGGNRTPRATSPETLASPSIQPNRLCSPLSKATAASPGDVNIGYSELSLKAFDSWGNGFSASLQHKRPRRTRHSSLVVEKAQPSITLVNSLASTSAPASSESLTSEYRLEDSSRPNNSAGSLPQGDSIASSDADTCHSSITNLEPNPQRHTAMLNIRRNIMEDREELEQYVVQVQKLELDRIELIGLQSRKRQERDVLENEIETLERLIREQSRGNEVDSSLGLTTENCCQAASSIGVFVPNNNAPVAYSTSTHTTAPSLRTITSNSGISTLSPTLSSFLPFSLSSPTIVATATIAKGLLPSPPPPSAQQHLQSKLTSSSMVICARCYQRALLLEKRTLLSQIHKEMEKIQRKINYTTSDIKHLERTFIIPIESCLAKDRDERTRLLSDQMAR